MVETLLTFSCKPTIVKLLDSCLPRLIHRTQVTENCRNPVKSRTQDDRADLPRRKTHRHSDGHLGRQLPDGRCRSLAARSRTARHLSDDLCPLWVRQIVRIRYLIESSPCAVFHNRVCCDSYYSNKIRTDIVRELRQYSVKKCLLNCRVQLWRWSAASIASPSDVAFTWLSALGSAFNPW